MHRHARAFGFGSSSDTVLMGWIESSEFPTCLYRLPPSRWCDLQISIKNHPSWLVEASPATSMAWCPSRFGAITWASGQLLSFWGALESRKRDSDLSSSTRRLGSIHGNSSQSILVPPWACRRALLEIIQWCFYGCEDYCMRWYYRRSSFKKNHGTNLVLDHECGRWDLSVASTCGRSHGNRWRWFRTPRQALTLLFNWNTRMLDDDK